MLTTRLSNRLMVAIFGEEFSRHHLSTVSQIPRLKSEKLEIARSHINIHLLSTVPVEHSP